MSATAGPLAARIERRIVSLRGQRVLLDEDVAVLYGVETRVLLQVVGCNRRRFPPDFLFRLTAEEHRNSRSRFMISSWGGRRTRPCAFAERGMGPESVVGALAGGLRQPQ